MENNHKPKINEEKLKKDELFEWNSTDEVANGAKSSKSQEIAGYLCACMCVCANTETRETMNEYEIVHLSLRLPNKFSIACALCNLSRGYHLIVACNRFIFIFTLFECSDVVQFYSLKLHFAHTKIKLCALFALLIPFYDII